MYYFCKSWLLHVEKVLQTTAEENLAMIEDTCRFLKSNGKEVIYDAEHFFDGYKDSPDYALQTLAAAKAGGADVLVLCIPMADVCHMKFMILQISNSEIQYIRWSTYT